MQSRNYKCQIVSAPNVHDDVDDDDDVDDNDDVDDDGDDDHDDYDQEQDRRKSGVTIAK